MPINPLSSFNVDSFDKWEEGEDRLEQPWSGQITLRCLSIFNASVSAVNPSSTTKEEWVETVPFYLQDLIDLDQEKALIVTPDGFHLTNKSEVESILSKVSAWPLFTKALKALNATRTLTGSKKLKLPKGYFITGVITLEAKDKNRYLIREQKYEIHSNGGKYLENCDKWYDIDLGRAKP